MRKLSDFSEEEKDRLYREWMRELSKKSVESRRKKYGVKGFSIFLRKIAKLPRKKSKIKLR